MTDTDKLVFISYRRSTSKYLARLIFDRLRAADYDAFLDVNTIDSGAFDSMILRQIGARPHFVLLVSPGALERCTDVRDWLRLEIEEAMRLGRNIVPLLEEGVDFVKESEYLPEHLRADFRRYNSIPLIHFYFDAAIDALVNRFLKQPIHSIRLLAPSPGEQKIVEKQVESVAASPPPTQEQLTAEQYLRMGNKKYREKDYDGAIEDYSKALRLDSQDAIAYNNRGGARYSKGDIDGAIADASEALRLNPEYSSAYTNRGNAYLSKMDYDAAIKDYDAAISLSPQSADAYFNRGNAHKASSQFDFAMADYTEALRINPQYVSAYRGRGSLQFRNEDYDGAIADYNKALRLDPKNSSAYFKRALAYNHKLDYQQAIADYNQVLLLDPESASAYNNRAEIYFSLGDYKAALYDFQRANGIEPAVNMVIGGMSITQHALGNIKEALRLWKTLIAQSENYRDADWVQKEFNWAEPLVEEARKLIAKL